jgi:hypothetical protein
MSWKGLDHRIDITIRVEAGGLASVLLAGKDFVRLVMREAAAAQYKVVNSCHNRSLH